MSSKKWLPCEVEALAIATSLQHWAPYVINSDHIVQVLTDSRPCIQAFAKLCRGEYSHSARVSTFLSTISRYQVRLQYIQGSVNLPADYNSRNPAECTEVACQICKFVKEATTSTVYSTSVSEILDGKGIMPFISPSAWKKSQQDCPSLRRVYAHLSQGTRPGHKDNNIPMVKRYLKECTIGRHGLLIVRKDMPFALTRDLIVIPVKALPGLVSALHLRLQHPSKSQMLKIFHRYFFAFDAEREITTACKLCPQCASMVHFPREIEEFSTTDAPQTLGTHFACDVLRRTRQFIFVVRDSFSSFTITKIIPDERAETFKSALIECTAELKSAAGCCVRIDAAPGFSPLVNDKDLCNAGITLDVGRLKNRNKNPIADKAIQELEGELKRVYPDGRPISSAGLSCITATLNKRVRNRGLSAREIVLQCDGFTGDHLNIDDDLLRGYQYEKRLSNHNASARSQAKVSRPVTKSKAQVGDLIFVKCDGDKHTSRDKYIVTRIEKDCLYARKLVGSQFRAKDYKLLYSEIYPVPTSAHPRTPHQRYQSEDTDSDSEVPNEHVQAELHHQLMEPGEDSDRDPVDDPPVGHDHADIDNPPADAPVVEEVYDLRPPPVPPDRSDSEDSGQMNNSDGDLNSDEEVEDQPRRRPRRHRKAPSTLNDYVLDTPSEGSDD